MKNDRSRPVAVGVCAALFAVLAACAEAPTAPDTLPMRAQVSPASPLVLTFDKTFRAEESSETLLVWRGTVQYDGETGDLLSTIDLTEPGTRRVGQILYATVRWEVTGDVEFVAETRGIVNFNTGMVRTNGRALSGVGEGGTVAQEGQLDEALNATGMLRVQAYR